MRFKKQAFLLATMFLAIAMLTACATTEQAPVAEKAPDTSWKFHDIVDAQFVKEQLQIPMPENVMLIDSRPFKPKYVKGHIPMAVSMPFSQMDKMIDQLPQSKDALLLFYCEGPT